MTLALYSKQPMRLKYATGMSMGEALQTNIQSATGADGRTQQLSAADPRDQAGSAFERMQQQMFIDSNNETNQFSVGSDQSKTALDYAALRRNSPAPISTTDAATAHGGGYYDSANNVIGVTDPNDVNVLAHEMGHAQFQQTLPGRLTQTNFARRMHSAAPMLGAGAGFFNTGTGKQRAIKALLIGLGLSSPVLLSEGVATYKGYQNLKDVGATDEELTKYKDRVLLPQLKYLVVPAVTTGLGILSSNIRAKSAMVSTATKLSSTANFDGIYNWNRNSQGTYNDQVPGDYLGFPASSLVGLRQTEGTPMTPSDRIDRMFRFNDQETNSRVLEGNTDAAPADPGV